MQFLLDAPKTLFEDERHRCVSYVPDPAVTWIVMDVSVLVGALAGRLGALTRRRGDIEEGGRLVRYVVSKQTDEGAWFYAEPPSASHITHDNYHTGFILDAILVYRQATEQRRVPGGLRQGPRLLPRPAVRAGRRSPVHERPALPGGHPRLRAGHHHLLAAAAAARADGGDMSRAGAGLDAGQHVGPEVAAGSTTRSAGGVPTYRTKIRELRWCQGWMSWALASHLEYCGAGGSVKGFPGRELSLDPAAAGSSAPTPRCSARRRTVCASGCGGCCPRPTARTATSSTPAAVGGVFSLELAKRHPRPQVIGVELEPDAGRPGQRDRAPGRAHQAAGSSRAT